MITKQLKYTDFNGNDKEETVYFHLTEVEVFRVAAKGKGGLADRLISLLRSEEIGEAFAMVEEIIGEAYGVKTLDGGFRHSTDDLRRWRETQGYSDFIVGLLKENGAEFQLFLSALLQPSGHNPKQPELPVDAS